MYRILKGGGGWAEEEEEEAGADMVRNIEGQDELETFVIHKKRRLDKKRIAERNESEICQEKKITVAIIGFSVL